MNTIQVYIWGVRRGFVEGTALYPERSRLTDASETQDYDNLCRYFTSAKDVAFRSGQKDFYFLMQDSNYHVYSLVDKTHQDIAGRETYLVFSIVCPKSNIITGSIKDGLRNLKNLYKTRNSDYSVQTNMFTSEQVRKEIAHLSFSRGAAQMLVTNSAYYFQNEAELNLNDYCGNEIYFMQTGSNPELPSHLGLSVQQSSLGQVNQQIQQNAQSIGEFRSLLSSKTNFSRAYELFSNVSSQLNTSEKTDFENWKSAEKSKGAVVQLKQLIALYAQNNATEIAQCESILAQFTTITNELSGAEQNQLKTWQNQVAAQKLAIEKNEIAEIEEQIQKAAKFNYEIPIGHLENKLKGLNLAARLSSDSKIKLKRWQDTQTYSDVLKEIINYNDLVHNSDRRTIINKQKEWIKTIDGWPQRLQGQSPFNDETKKKYQYLIGKTWVKEDKPIAKVVLMAFVAIALTGGGFFAAMNWDNWFPKIVDVPKDPKPPTPQPEPGDVNEVVTPTNGEQYTAFEYKGKTYRVEKSLLTEAGSKYNANKRFYRYVKDKWEMKEVSDDAKWKPATPISDISLILTKWDEKFRTDQNTSKGDTDTNNGGNTNTTNGDNTNNNNGGKAKNINGDKANNNNDGKTNNNNDGKANNNNGGEEDNEKATGEIDDPIYIDAIKKAVKSKNCGKECIENDKKLSRKVKDRLIDIIPK